MDTHADGTGAKNDLSASGCGRGEVFGWWEDWVRREIMKYKYFATLPGGVQPDLTFLQIPYVLFQY